MTGPGQSSVVEWAVARKVMPGCPSGAEQYVVKATPNGFLVALIDSMGYSPQALSATQTAVATLDEYTHQTIADLLLKCDRACQSTSGVSMVVAIFSASYPTVTWFGVGNVEAVLFHKSASAEPRYHILSQQPGRVGQGLTSLKELSLPVRTGDNLVLASDGILTGFVEALPIEGKPKVVADQLMSIYGATSDEATLLVTRYVGAG